MSLGEILLIPGVTDPLTQLKSLLFKQGQAGGIWVPSLSPTMISSESFGTGVQTFLDLSGNGKNATQASSGSRPAWGRVPKSGRRNLQLHSEDLSNVLWTKTAVTLGSVQIVNGNVAVTEIVEDATTDQHRLQYLYSRVSGQQYTVSVYAKKGVGTRFLILNFANFMGAEAGFNLDTGTTVNVTGSAAIESIGGGVYRCSVTGTAPSTGTATGFLQIDDNGSSGSYAGDGVSSIFVGGVQFETGSTATAYQKVTTAFDITESGQRDCYYLQPDGVDDGMATASIDFSGTDKVTVFAAVRSFVDTPQGIIFENPSTLPFDTFLSDNRATGKFGVDLRDVSNNQINGLSTTARTKPINQILRVRFDLSETLASNKIRLFENGSDVTAVGTVGTFTRTAFLNAALHFFRRSNGTAHSNLQFFGGIVAGGNYPVSVEERVERILSRYTPGVSL